MAQPETCPACHGEGAINWERLDGSVVELKFKCPNCEGRGWVVVLKCKEHIKAMDTESIILAAIKRLGLQA